VSIAEVHTRSFADSPKRLLVLDQSYGRGRDQQQQQPHQDGTRRVDWVSGHEKFLILKMHHANGFICSKIVLEEAKSALHDQRLDL
jgi:hypothetical protein